MVPADRPFNPSALQDYWPDLVPKSSQINRATSPSRGNDSMPMTEYPSSHGMT